MRRPGRLHHPSRRFRRHPTRCSEGGGGQLRDTAATMLPGSLKPGPRTPGHADLDGGGVRPCGSSPPTTWATARLPPTKGTPAGGVSEQVVEPENSAPTGPAPLSGNQVDQTLTADTSPIDDADGLTNAIFEYQWIAGGAESGATGASYTLTASEQGQTIQVRVTFTDDADNEETLTSEATGEVTAAAPAPLTGAFHHRRGRADQRSPTATSEDVGSAREHARRGFQPLCRRRHRGTQSRRRNDLWEITVEPDDNSDVGITLPANRSCTTAGAICTRGDSPRQLTNSPTATVTGPAEAPPTNRSAAGAPTSAALPRLGRPSLGHVLDHRRGRPDQRFLQLPVDRRRVGHRGGHRLHLHPDCQRAGTDRPGAGHLHRRRR